MNSICFMSVHSSINNDLSDLEASLEATRNGRINPYVNLENFLNEAECATVRLPIEIIKQLQELKENRSEQGFVYIRGLPVDKNLCQTPGDEGFIYSHKSSYVSEFMLSTVGKFFGEPFNYIQEEKGNIFRNVRPTRKNADAQTSDSSTFMLTFHTETAFHPFRPDYLLLYCLRGDENKEAYTMVSGLKDILKRLDADTLEELRKPQFKTIVDESFGNMDRKKIADELVPILRGEGNDVTLVYDFDYTIGITEKAKEALTRLSHTIEEVQTKVLLEPGDVLVVDNRRAVHSRSPYRPKFDGYDRWLQRLYISIDKDFAKNIPYSGRIINTEF